jgi:hypothetical protein
MLVPFNSQGNSDALTTPPCIIPPRGKFRCLELLTGMATLALGLIALPHSVPRVDDGGLLHDETVLLQPGDVATGVGQGNFVDFIWVQPDFALAAFEDRSGEALLELKRH